MQVDDVPSERNSEVRNTTRGDDDAVQVVTRSLRSQVGGNTTGMMAVDSQLATGRAQMAEIHLGLQLLLFAWSDASIFALKHDAAAMVCQCGQLSVSQGTGD